VTKVQDFHFIPGTLEALKLLTDAGYHIFVISNQAGVGKGVYSRRKLDLITERMQQGVKEAGARLTGVYYCTCRSTDGCNCRKPRIGNIIKALKQIGQGPEAASDAYFVGDTEGDIKTGKNAGCRTVFALCGREDREYMKRWDVRPDFIVEDLYAAAKLIISQDPRHSRDSRRRSSQGR
jgi:histidinol-phosphate phosphatase family protein